jgi:DNA (cytosine-5)-methyltransferase 1
MSISTAEFLETQYQNAISTIGSKETITTNLNTLEQAYLNTILQYSESAKGVLTVFITSVVYKILNPDQDIRKHQDGISGGYSGRTFDTKYITPFLKKHQFPAMAESGWLTRSLEQKVPYDFNYPGAIRPDHLKAAFLTLVDNIQKGADCIGYLSYVFQGLIIKRNQQVIDLTKPTALSIHTILQVLEQHFNAAYQAEGASRLPVLAFYAIYECLLQEVRRFHNKQLLPLESHTSADRRSGRIGDIDIIDENERAFEAVEVKHRISISLQLVQDAYAKFRTTPVSRYYILSTAPPPDDDEWNKIQSEVKRIKNAHGCQVIVNGVMPSLNYYLRLLNNTFEFIDKYVNLLENDTALKFEHKLKWNQLTSEIA